MASPSPVAQAPDAAPVTLPLCVIVLTYNEEMNLPECLRSVQGLAMQVVVVDSGSTDRTIEIARESGTEVVQHAFETQALQLNWALDNVSLQGDWVLRLDADERVTPELAGELRQRLPGLGPEITALYVKRRVYFLGRWIRHGGYYPTWLLRVWRRGCARSEDRRMDEHMILLRGHPAMLAHDIREENLKPLAVWIDRQNGYSTREVQALLERSSGELPPAAFGTPEARRRWLKYNVYLRFPPFLRAFCYFFYRYFFRLGFLDGTPGLIFHFLQGCWHRFLIDAKLYEAKLRQRRAQAQSRAGETQEQRPVRP